MNILIADDNSEMRSFIAEMISDIATNVYEASDGPIVQMGGTPISQRSNPTVVPAEYILHQNYPNPFNPSTPIENGISEEGNVQLRMFDPYDHEVLTLVDEVREPGTDLEHFDATDLPSGAYMYQIEWNGNVQVKRMILVKRF